MDRLPDLSISGMGKTGGGKFSNIANIEPNTEWQLPWFQPAWDSQSQTEISPEVPPLYQEPDWQEAVKLLDFPLYAPPQGYSVEDVRVVSDNRSILAGDRNVTPRTLDATIKTPEGKRIHILESRTLLTLVPAFESLEQFLESQKRGTNSAVQGFKSSNLAGIPMQEWNLKAGDGKEGSVIYLYPEWGSIELEAALEYNTLTPEELRKIAKDWVPEAGPDGQ